jgi:hypothetical protein
MKIIIKLVVISVLTPHLFSCSNSDEAEGENNFDADSYGIQDTSDNCSEKYNPNQHDFYGNDIGNSCDTEDTTPHFGILTATLDGRNMRLVVGDETRELTHARIPAVNPQWLTLTRYTQTGEDGDGLAKQGGEYTVRTAQAKNGKTSFAIISLVQ